MLMKKHVQALLVSSLTLLISVVMLANTKDHDTIPPPEVNFIKDLPPPKKLNKISFEKVKANSPVGHFTNFDTEQGLALSNITCVFTDSRGKIWIGTHGGGVSIFNGKTFKTITSKNGLIHNSIWAISEDSNGNIWFGSFGGGLTKYDGISFKSYTTDDGLANNTVWQIFDDGEGKIWIGTFGGGVSIYDGETFETLTEENGLPSNIVWDIIKDREGNMWFGTENGVSKFDGNSFLNYSEKDGLVHNVVRGIVEDRLGNFWFATFGGGASYFDGQKFTNYTVKEGLSHNVIRDLIEDSNGNIWFATHGGGASMFDGNHFTNFTTDEGIANNILRGLTEDKQGNIWFGTDGGGASRYNGKAFTIYTKEQGLIYNAVRHIAEDNKGRLWYGTNGGGFSIFDGLYFYNYKFENGIPINTIYCIHPNDDGSTWIATTEGLVLFKDGKGVIYTSDNGLAHTRVLCIYKDSENTFWFGTANGISKFDGKSFTNYRTEHGLAHPMVRSIEEDKSGNIWASTYGGGISKFDRQRFYNYTTEDGIGHNWVRKILIDSNGYIWLGTYGGGVNRYDGNSFIKFTTDDGLADDVVYDMVEDEDGIIWIGTNLGYSGLFFIDKNSNEKFTSGHLDIDNETLKNNFIPYWEIFNNQTGFPLKDINSNAMCISQIGLPSGKMKDKGIIWAGCGDDKVACFDPKSIRRSNQPPNLVLRNIRINEKSICWYSLKHFQKKCKGLNGELINDSIILAQQQIMTYGRMLTCDMYNEVLSLYENIRFDNIEKFTNIPQKLVLPYEHNHITFEFIAVETGRNLMINYQYMLEGMDKNWRPVTKNNFVTFSNLWEGKYTFKVRAQSADGIWSEPISYDFRVTPPWFRAFWMYVIYLFTFLFAVWVFFKWRLGSLTREKLILAKKVEERTAELLLQKEEAERQKSLVEEKNQEILEQKEEILQQKEELQVQSRELERINSNLEDRIAEQLAESRKKDFLLIQQSRQAAMGEMIANIAHQWRQPLNAVGLIIQNIQDSYDYNEMTQEYLDNKVKQSMDIIQYMSDTINDFRDFFKPDKMASKFDVKKIVLRSISFVEDTLKKCNITIEHNLEDEIIAFGYQNEYAQVVLNIINNAKDVLVDNKIKEPKITVNLTSYNGKSRLTIEDNGGGIPPGLEKKIFEPYFSTKKSGEGTGLGLYMSKTIIEKIEGSSLTVENTEKGAKFTIIV